MPQDHQEYVTKGSCDQHTQSMMESQDALLEKLESIEKRLFKDNGRVSMQTRIDRHEQALRLLLWVVGIIGGTLLSGMAGGLALLVREVMLRGVGA
jgi:hypothetical protein